MRRRREFITLLGGAAAWPLAARAQQAPKLPTIGFLGVDTPAARSQLTTAFVLRELGWVEGRTVILMSGSSIELWIADGGDCMIENCRPIRPGLVHVSESRELDVRSHPAQCRLNRMHAEDELRGAATRMCTTK
jgi:hypothetical protein